MIGRKIIRSAVMTGGVLFAALGFWGLHNFRLTLNGSDSMPEHAYLMWAWPKVVWRGAVIAAEPPEAYQDRFTGFYFTKKVYGVPGDVIRHEGDSVCVNETCFPIAIRNDRPFAPPISEGVIPDGRYAAFGTSLDSLDSRYETVGLFPEERIIAVGVGTNLIPHWKELKKWADERGY